MLIRSASLVGLPCLALLVLSGPFAFGDSYAALTEYPSAEPPPAFEGVLIDNQSSVEVTLTLEGWEIDMNNDGKKATPSMLEASARVYQGMTLTVPAGSNRFVVDVRPPGSTDAGKPFNGVAKLVAKVTPSGGAQTPLAIEADDFVGPDTKHWRRAFCNFGGGLWPTLTITGSKFPYGGTLAGACNSGQPGDPGSIRSSSVTLPK